MDAVTTKLLETVMQWFSVDLDENCATLSESSLHGLVCSKRIHSMNKDNRGFSIKAKGITTLYRQKGE